MSNGDVSQGRRRFLIGATSVVGGVGVVGAAVPFVASWNPSAKAEAAGAPVTVNVSKLEPGQQMTVKWRGKLLLCVSRLPLRPCRACLSEYAGTLESSGASLSL